MLGYGLGLICRIRGVDLFFHASVFLESSVVLKNQIARILNKSVIMRLLITDPSAPGSAAHYFTNVRGMLSSWDG